MSRFAQELENEIKQGKDMTNKQELYALADKVEKLEGGCWETNNRIMDAVGLVINAMDRPDAKPFTHSIDAAMTLVPEGWAIYNFSIHSDKSCSLEMYRQVIPDGEDAHKKQPRVEAESRFPSLALVAISLRAIGGKCE